jgi:HD-like signal output (HDOD) protein
MADINWTQLREQTVGRLEMRALPPTIKLPALPHAVTQFIEQSQNPNVGLKQLSTILETDTGITTELLRYVNSTYFGLRNKARNVLQALTLLGQRQSRMFVVTTGMQAAIQSRQSKLLHQGCFWNASLQKALFAREVAELLGADTDLAFSAGLMQDFLLPVLTNDLYDFYSSFVTDRETLPPLLTTHEQGTYAWDHAIAAATLAANWKLPDDLICCILLHHSGLKLHNHPLLGKTAAFAVATSGLLPDQLRQVYNGLEQLMELEKVWPEFHLDELVETVDRKHAEIGLGVQNDFPLSRRCRTVLEECAKAAG